MPDALSDWGRSSHWMEASAWARSTLDGASVVAIEDASKGVRSAAAAAAASASMG